MWPLAKKKVRGDSSPFKEFTQNPHLSEASWVTPPHSCCAAEHQLQLVPRDFPWRLCSQAPNHRESWPRCDQQDCPPAWSLASLQYAACPPPHTQKEYGDRGHCSQCGLSLCRHTSLQSPAWARSSLFSKKNSVHFSCHWTQKKIKPKTE